MPRTRLGSAEFFLSVSFPHSEYRCFIGVQIDCKLVRVTVRSTLLSASVSCGYVRIRTVLVAQSAGGRLTRWLILSRGIPQTVHFTFLLDGALPCFDPVPLFIDRTIGMRTIVLCGTSFPIGMFVLSSSCSTSRVPFQRRAPTSFRTATIKKGQ